MPTPMPCRTCKTLPVSQAILPLLPDFVYTTVMSVLQFKMAFKLLSRRSWVEAAVKAPAYAGDATRLKTETSRGTGLSMGAIEWPVSQRSATPCLVYVTAFEEVIKGPW